MNRLQIIFTGLLLVASLLANQAHAADPNKLLLFSDIKWEKLNPARGDNSPRASTLWGDRHGPVPTGFLVMFEDGFSSPPHIHNTTYRAVVIKGEIHNDDPAAKPMWMPAGSFWTQPKGEVHITAAKGSKNIALVEIDWGPYQVLAVENEFDSGERPLNLELSNIVWLDLPGMPADTERPKIAYLWRQTAEGGARGTFLKLPPGFKAELTTESSTFNAVIIQGNPTYLHHDKKILEPGSYFGSRGEAVHKISADNQQATIIYISSTGDYQLKQ